MVLEFKEINKSFGEKRVLDQVTFTASSGKAFGLLGRNGAGKTTSIRILMDVIPADSGSVLIDGAPIDYDKTRIGYLPEERGLYPKKPIIDQLVYFAQLKGMSRGDAVASVDRWLDRLGMSEYRGKRLDTLSKGNQQKIQLVTALAHDPHVVILDEPFSGLDPVNAMLLKDVVNEEIGRGKIVLFSSHQMNYIEEFCDSIAILSAGRIAVTGDLREIKRSYPRNSLVVRSEAHDAILCKFGDCSTVDESGDIIIKLSSPEEKGRVMAELATIGDIDSMMVYEPSLNDIFVEYAKDSI